MLGAPCSSGASSTRVCAELPYSGTTLATAEFEVPKSMAQYAAAEGTVSDTCKN
jgi:hypothetical protein